MFEYEIGEAGQPDRVYCGRQVRHRHLQSSKQEDCGKTTRSQGLFHLVKDKFGLGKAPLLDHLLDGRFKCEEQHLVEDHLAAEHRVKGLNRFGCPLDDLEAFLVASE